MKRKLWVAILLSLTAIAVVELIFVPTVGVLASPPNVPSSTCVVPRTPNSSPPCTLAADYYRGGGSLTYCYFGEGALYLRGVYYPLVQPAASAAREISNPFCPAMHP